MLTKTSSAGIIAHSGQKCSCKQSSRQSEGIFSEGDGCCKALTVNYVNSWSDRFSLSWIHTFILCMFGSTWVNIRWHDELAGETETWRWCLKRRTNIFYGSGSVLWIKPWRNVVYCMLDSEQNRFALVKKVYLDNLGHFNVYILLMSI